METPRVSLAAVARCARVSISTVSRALKGDPRISRETRERVCRLAEEMGYRPDPIAAQLAQNRWQTPAGFAGLTLAYVHCTDPSVASLGRNILLPPIVAKAAAERGYHLDAFNLAEYGCAKALNRVLRSRGIRGVLVAPLYSNDPALYLDFSEFCVVSLGPGFHPLPVHRVYFSAYEQVDCAIRKAREAGYQRIAVVLMTHANEMEDDHQRIGAVTAHQRIVRDGPASISLFTSPFFESQYLYWRLAIRLRTWIRETRPDVVIGFNGMIYAALREAHCGTCPGDFAFINLHRCEEYAFCAGITDATEDVARTGVKVLDSLLRNNERGLPAHPLRFMVSPDWHDGSTLPVRTGAFATRADGQTSASNAQSRVDVMEHRHAG